MSNDSFNEKSPKLTLYEKFLKQNLPIRGNNEISEIFFQTVKLVKAKDEKNNNFQTKKHPTKSSKKQLLKTLRKSRIRKDCFSWISDAARSYLSDAISSDKIQLSDPNELKKFLQTTGLEGLVVQIEDAVNKKIKGISGIVLAETQKTFLIAGFDSRNAKNVTERVKVIPKKGCVFQFCLPDVGGTKRINIRVDGSSLLGVAMKRLKIRNLNEIPCR